MGLREISVLFSPNAPNILVLLSHFSDLDVLGSFFDYYDAQNWTHLAQVDTNKSMWRSLSDRHQVTGLFRRENPVTCLANFHHFTEKKGPWRFREDGKIRRNSAKRRPSRRETRPVVIIIAKWPSGKFTD